MTIHLTHAASKSLLKHIYVSLFAVLSDIMLTFQQSKSIPKNLGKHVSIMTFADIIIWGFFFLSQDTFFILYEAL